MLSTLIEMLFQEWMVKRSDGFAKWLYGSEAFLGLIFTLIAINYVGPIALLSIFYSVWQVTKYFEAQRKRSVANNMNWNPSPFAVGTAFIFFAMSVIFIPPLMIFLVFATFDISPLLSLLIFVVSIFGVYRFVKALALLRISEWPGDDIF